MFVFLVYGVNELYAFCLLEDVSTRSLSTAIYLLVFFYVLDSVSLGFSQTIGKLIGGDGWVVRFAETLDSDFFAMVTMSFTYFIIS